MVIKGINSKFNIKNGLIIFFMIALFICSSTDLFSQITSRKDKQLLLKADKAFDLGDYLSAMKMYESIYTLDSNDNETNYKLGICNFELKKFRKNSKHYFAKVSAVDYPEVNYYLARLSHLDRDYEKAIFYYNQYKYFGEDNEFSKREIDDLIAKSNTAMVLESTADKSVKIQNLGSTINTEYPEYAPMIPADESFMLFTSRRKNAVWTNTDPLGDYFEDVYVSKKGQDGTWQVPAMLDSSINTATHDACTGLSADGDKLLLYRTSSDLKSGNIFESYLKDSKWSAPENIGANVNSDEYLETSACFSSNGDIIFFSSNRPEGYGGKDIYLVKKLQNGSWGKPFNLGPKINTEYDEDAPFVHPLNNILYFSSQGHKNMGGFDIFKSTFDEITGKFEEPENLGCPINTSDDDIFFVMNTDATKAYLSSERDGGFGLQDIYSVSFENVTATPLNVYNIHVTDESNTVLKDVELRAVDTEKESVYGNYKANDKTGKIIIISQPNKEYRLIIDAPGYERFVATTVLNTNMNLLFKLTKQNK